MSSQYCLIVGAHGIVQFSEIMLLSVGIFMPGCFRDDMLYACFGV